MLAFWFIYKNLPETKGKSLQEIITLFVDIHAIESANLNKKPVTEQPNNVETQ